MKTLIVPTVDGFQKENVYSIAELSLLRHNLECKESTKRKIKYLEIPCAFDIETTNIFKKDEKPKQIRRSDCKESREHQKKMIENAGYRSKRFQ